MARFAKLLVLVLLGVTMLIALSNAIGVEEDEVEYLGEGEDVDDLERKISCHCPNRADKYRCSGYKCCPQPGTRPQKAKCCSGGKKGSWCPRGYVKNNKCNKQVCKAN